MNSIFHRRSRVAAYCFFAAFIFFIAGLSVGFQMRSRDVPVPGSYGPIRTTSKEYRLIHPLLACDFPGNQANDKLLSLRSDLSTMISNLEDSGKVEQASIFLRMLKSGENIGMNEKILYNPASMMKVLVMITYARSGEQHADLFAKKLTMTQEIMESEDHSSYYGSTSLSVGESYRIGDLIDKMIIDSDNGAKDLLVANISKEELVKTARDFSVTVADQETGEIEMSPKDISLLFHALYNATYLDQLHSEVALELLLRTTFKEGLVEGVPYGTQIAHKFGEYIIPDQNGKVGDVELHDCGIVYAPNNPYFLCVMTKGKSHEVLASVISNISSRVYAVATDPRL